MQKPAWRVLSSRVVVDSPYMRLRADEIELPDGTIVPDYFVRESRGYTIVFALTPDLQVVLVRQYRHGADAITLELPAGAIDGDEDPRDCAIRELLEETGFEGTQAELIAVLAAEPVRSNSHAYIFVVRDAVQTRPPQPEPSEFIEVELVALETFRRMLAEGTLDSVAATAAGYRALDRLGAL